MYVGKGQFDIILYIPNYLHFLSGPPVSKPSVTHYAPQVAPRLSAEEDYQRVLKLLFDIRNANSSSVMPPVVNIVDLNKFRTNPIPVVHSVTSLPDHCLEFDIPFAHHCDVSSYPLPLTKMPFQTFGSIYERGFKEESQRFISSLSYSDRDIKIIEEITRDQALSDEWFEQRKGCISGSKVARILSYMKNGRANADLIVKEIMQYNTNRELSSKVPALAWGTKYESKALSMYVKDMSKCHKGVELIRPGLLVHPDAPYIRVSPDAVISCECHGRFLVEVKCPISHKNNNIQEEATKGELGYIQTVDNTFSVKKGESRGYHEQITLQQAISGEKKAVLLVWSKKSYLAVSMDFDIKYWEETMYPSVKSFFKDHIVPEILTSRIFSGLEPTKSLSCFGQSDTTSDHSCEIKPTSDTDDQLVDLDGQLEFISNGTEESPKDQTSLEQLNNVSACKLNSLPPLGCLSYCKDSHAPNFSKVKGQILICDANLLCAPNTGYHYFCEGFRRLPKEKDSLPCYACKKCMTVHPQKKDICVNNGFYQ